MHQSRKVRALIGRSSVTPISLSRGYEFRIWEFSKAEEKLDSATLQKVAPLPQAPAESPMDPLDSSEVNFLPWAHVDSSVDLSWKLR